MVKEDVEVVKEDVEEQAGQVEGEQPQHLQHGRV